MIYAIVRIRGTINAKPEIKSTLDMLNLAKINSCTFITDSPSYKGMLQKVKDYVTWGEITDDMMIKILQRGKVENTEEIIKRISSGESIKKIGISSIGLHPPRKGYRAIKKPYQMGGSSGYRGSDINSLIERML